MRRSFQVILAALLLAWPGQALAEPSAGWLDRVNRSLFAFNRDAQGVIAGALQALPEITVAPEVREGATNLVSTWVAQPWHALALAVAGRPEESLTVLERVRTNILEGQGGLIDRASQRGLPRAPHADMGLALCARGVPDGPYVVLPIIGGRTLRDGLSDLVVANAVIYGAMVPFTGPTPPIEVFVAVELLDNIPAWALADRMGRVDGVDPAQMSYEAARDAYLRERREACALLRERRIILE